MTPPNDNESIHPITGGDYERIIQSPQQAEAGESPEQATLKRATSIAAIGLMRDAMLTDEQAATALWSDLQREADGSGLLNISHTVTYVSKPTMEALAAMATSQRELGTAKSQVNTILPVDSETLRKHISDACSSAGLNGIYGADSPRAGMTLDLLRSDFTVQQVLTAGRWNKMSTFGQFVCSITGGPTLLEELLGKEAVVELDNYRDEDEGQAPIHRKDERVGVLKG